MKARIVIKLLFVSMLILGLGCKKKSKELTTVNFHLYNPVSNEAYAGVKVSILQEKNTSKGFNSSSETEVIWRGVTDAYGKASHSFKAYNNQQYFYWQYVENSFVQNPNLKLLKQPAFLPLNKNEVNEVEYRYTVPASYVIHYKNVNCIDGTDRFRRRVKRLYGTVVFGWTNWSQDQFGCYDNFINNNNSYNDYLIIEYEVERNNVLNTYMDTFYISPYSVDTFKIYY